MKPSPEEIEKAMRFDGLSHAEELSGKDYKTDPLTEAVGVCMVMQNGMHKRQLLEKAGDTYTSMDYEVYRSIVEAEGFVCVHSHTFPSSRRDKSQDVYEVFWNEEGLLLTMESYNSNVNTANLYYNIILPCDENRYNITSSGHYYKDENGSYDKNIWVGNHHILEGFRHILNEKIRKHSPLKIWVEQPHVWLIDYSASKSVTTVYPASSLRYKEITDDCIASFPQHVQDAIRGNM